MIADSAPKARAVPLGAEPRRGAVGTVPHGAPLLAMGIAYNLAVATFGGTAPFIIASLIELTGDDMAIAYYLMAVAVVAAVAIWFLPESARRHLPRSMPSVESEEAARNLVETQDRNPLRDLDSLPFESSFEIARAEHKGRPGKPTVM